MKKRFLSMLFIILMVGLLPCMAMAASTDNAVGKLYNISIDEDITNGTVTADKATASAGEIVTLTVKPDSGYALKWIQVNSEDPEKILGKTKITFTMPEEDVTIFAGFVEGMVVYYDNSDSQWIYALCYHNGGYEQGSVLENDIYGFIVPANTSGRFTNYMPGMPAEYCPDGIFRTETFNLEEGKTYRYTGRPVEDCPGDSSCPMYPFTDLDASLWYHDGIHYCIEQGLMQGVGTKQFAPDSTTTRAMIVTILWRLEGKPIVDNAMDFDDVAADTWYTEAIRWAANKKIVEGYGNGRFGTNDAITREQMVTIMWRYAKYKGYDVSVGQNTNILSYDDAAKVAEWAIPAMKWACGSSMIQGIADGSAMNLAPQGSATRAQIATILQRYCKNVANEVNNH